MPRRWRKSIIGLFILKTDGAAPDGGPVLARIHGELWALVFSTLQRAEGTRVTLGIGGARPFYVCAANTKALLAELRTAGARGFILDYDPQTAAFAGAGSL